MQLFELGEIHAIARSVGGTLHRPQVSQRADWGDGVGCDLDADVVSLQLGEGWYSIHSVQYLNLAVLGLDLEARWSGERGSCQRPLDRVFASEGLEARREAVHVRAIWRGHEVEIARGAHDAVCSNCKSADNHVLDLCCVECGHEPAWVEDRLSVHRRRPRANRRAARLASIVSRIRSLGDRRRCTAMRDGSFQVPGASRCGLGSTS